MTAFFLENLFLLNLSEDILYVPYFQNTSLPSSRPPCVQAAHIQTQKQMLQYITLIEFRFTLNETAK